ncbi:MAG: DUF3048 domain-containing protein [Caldilineaceae bacterium]|nr:DUF3048 domain-containing protein [Caldilineaceae bacterium]
MLRLISRYSILLLFLLWLTGCVASPEPTPTPTKTPPAMAPTATEPAVQSADTGSEPAAVATTPAPTPVVVEPTATATPLPGNIAPFTGLPAENPELLHRRPVLICVNNDTVGRSVHYGLSQADLVYEYIVDGFSMTRLTAIYQSQEAGRVGPVRSARYPNIWITYMYDGVLACSGGSDQIRYLLKNEVGFPYLDADIDDPSNNVYFFSIGTDYRTRMQVSTEGVRRWLDDHNRQKEWSRPGFAFNPQPPQGASGTSDDIAIAYPGGNSVEWRYDAAQGGYLRWQGGQQQSDPATGRPILSENVIVVAAEHQLTDIVEDSLGTKGVDVTLYGFGDLRVFRDGQVYEGTWRADPETPPRWIGPGEVTIELKPGQSWIQVVQQLGDIQY